MILDTTVSSKIEAPSLNSWEYFSKEKNGFFLKYEIGCSLGVPRICWFNGPHKPVVDSTIAKSSHLLSFLLPTERLLADKIYKGDRGNFICPLTGKKWTLPKEDQTRNYMIYSARQSVERLIKRVKQFGFFHVVWKYSHVLHAQCAKIIAKLTNLFLIFKPLG
jgi:DDE superfamily endonuclease